MLDAMWLNPPGLKKVKVKNFVYGPGSIERKTTILV